MRTASLVSRAQPNRHPAVLPVATVTAHLHPNERIYTFWVNAAAFKRNAGFRMDFLLLNPEAATALRAAGVDSEHRGRDKPSDHAPTWAELEIP